MIEGRLAGSSVFVLPVSISQFKWLLSVHAFKNSLHVSLSCQTAERVQIDLACVSMLYYFLNVSLFGDKGATVGKKLTGRLQSH